MSDGTPRRVHDEGVYAQLQHVRLAKYILVVSLVFGALLLSITFSFKGIDPPSWLGLSQGVGGFFWVPGLIMIFYNLRLDCPKCKKPFNVRVLNMMQSGNPFRLQCGNWGLRMDGRNLNEVGIDS